MILLFSIKEGSVSVGIKDIYYLGDIIVSSSMKKEYEIKEVNIIEKDWTLYTKRTIS